MSGRDERLWGMWCWEVGGERWYIESWGIEKLVYEIEIYGARIRKRGWERNEIQIYDIYDDYMVIWWARARDGRDDQWTKGTECKR